MAKREPNLGTFAPTEPAEHKGPGERAHLWDRPKRPDEAPPAAAATDYAHETPRWVHKDGAQKRVETPEDCAEALADGWLTHPAE